MAKVTLGKILNHEYKCWLYSAFFFLVIGSAASAAITLLWWLRIQPWYAHGEGTCIATYIITIICWVSSAIIFILIVLIKPISIGGEDNTKRATIYIAFLFIFAFISIISSVILARMALIVEIGIFTNVNFKCYHDFVVSATLGGKMLKWAVSHDKLEQFLKWFDNFSKKIFEDESMTTFTDYLCSQVGIPTAIACSIVFLGLICFCRVIDMIRKQPEAVENLIADSVNNNNNYTVSKF